MSARTTSDEAVVALFDSVTGQTFGTVFETPWDAEEFLDFAHPRCIAQGGVQRLTPQQFGALRFEWEASRVDA